MRADPTPPSTRPRWLPRPRPVGSVAILAVLAVVVACSSDPPPAPFPRPIDVTVRHGDETTDLQVLRGTAIERALELAKVTPRDGQLVSAGKKAVIEPNGDRASIEVEGHEVSEDLALRRHTTIEVIDGTDTVEDTKVERRAKAPDGLPNAIQYVQFAGTTGLEDVTIGVTSGEVVKRKTVRAGKDAHRATGPVLSLTFDDGPDGRYTPRILDILASKGVKATFCQIGTSVESNPELTKRIHDEGHALCNHTEHHVERLEQEPQATIDAEIGGGRDAITKAAGEAPPFYRPPGGSLAPAIYDAAAEHDEHVLYWAIDPADWKKPPAQEIVLNVVAKLSPGAIILLHDGGGDREATVAALPQIIDAARARGYTFTLPLSNRSQVG